MRTGNSCGKSRADIATIAIAAVKATVSGRKSESIAVREFKENLSLISEFS